MNIDIKRVKQKLVAKIIRSDVWNFRSDDPSRILIVDRDGMEQEELSLQEVQSIIQSIKNDKDLLAFYQRFGFNSDMEFKEFVLEVLE